MAYAQPAPVLDHDEEDESLHSHPGEREYIRIAIILALITVAEVGIYYFEAVEALLVPALIVLSTIKFVMVVSFFMHLKFDDKRLAMIFASAMGVALAIYVGTWAMGHYHQVSLFFSDMIA
jgi:cytochrome c oxidase subunit 4